MLLWSDPDIHQVVLKAPDPRKPKRVRHKLAGFLTLIALAVAAGCKGPHAISEFAKSLNHAQRGRLRWRPRPVLPREYDVPSERTFRRLLELARDHWSTENGQYYRRDRTQDEDRCLVRDTTSAHNLSLFRSLAIFLFKWQSKEKGGKKPGPTLSVMYIAGLGGRLTDSHNAGMRNKPWRQSASGGAGILSADPRVLPP
jgi:hypothetical protein